MPLCILTAIGAFGTGEDSCKLLHRITKHLKAGAYSWRPRAGSKRGKCQQRSSNFSLGAAHGRQSLLPPSVLQCCKLRSTISDPTTIAARPVQTHFGSHSEPQASVREAERSGDRWVRCTDDSMAHDAERCSNPNRLQATQHPSGPPSAGDKVCAASTATEHCVSATLQPTRQHSSTAARGDRKKQRCNDCRIHGRGRTVVDDVGAVLPVEEHVQVRLVQHLWQHTEKQRNEREECGAVDTEAARGERMDTQRRSRDGQSARTCSSRAQAEHKHRQRASQSDSHPNSGSARQHPPASW